jgi:hypothetical protein
MPSGFPGSPITRHSSCKVALACELNDDSTSHRSIASSVYQWREKSTGANAERALGIAPGLPRPVKIRITEQEI